ncbi:MAG: family 43 glycosylhydrolase [Lachnospiraceae bacterium]|nr:family 43 glycosylhydrolase [Lachnospiraceae bacterium]
MQSSIEQAIILENLEEVERLLTEEPPIIDEVDREGLPMSFLAARTGNLSIVKYIVEYSRASMNVTDGMHRNILHYGAMSGNLELVQYLVERVGMSPLSGDNELLTPFDIAHFAAAEQTAGERIYSKYACFHADFAGIEDYFTQVVGFSYEESYRNPIRTGFYPDPSIVRVGEDYYMVNSSFIFFPCIPISHSRDLIHWEIIGYAITNPNWAKLDGLEGGRGYWAPDISYYKGRYYICATYRLNDTGTVYRKQMVVSSDKPEGPYSEPVFLDEDGIDPSIFTDDDGRRYMLLNRGARIFEISEDAARQIGEASLLFYGDHKRAPEGPHLLKKDGYYYLFEAEGGTGMGHRVTVSRSRELFGIYEPCPYNPILRQMDETAPIQRCGHGKPVQTPDGDWYMVYLCGRQIDGAYSILGRETALDPITWTADGWPIVNGLKGPSVLQKRPLLLQEAGEEGHGDCKENINWVKEFALQDSDGEESKNLLGEGSRLPLDWMTPRPPEEDAIRLEEGILSLKGSRLPLSDVGSRNILLRRQEHFIFTASTLMEYLPMQEGQEAGLICYYDENTWVSCSLSKEQNGEYIQVKEHIGEQDIIHGKTRLAEALTSIEFTVETKKLQRSFFYRINGGEKKTAAQLQNVYYLCDEGLKKGKRFTGAMVGLFAYAGEENYRAKFLNFFYKINI